MKIVCKETFEQGQAKADGGMFKMVANQGYEATMNADGSALVTLAGRQRTISRELLEELSAADLIEIE